MQTDNVLNYIEKLKKGMETAKALADKIEPHLPQSWRIYMGTHLGGEVVCVHGQETSPDPTYNAKNDFVRVCALFEHAGVKLKRTIYKHEDAVSFHGEGNIEDLPVRVCQYSNQGCEIKFVKETKEVTEVILSDECLHALR